MTTPTQLVIDHAKYTLELRGLLTELAQVEADMTEAYSNAFMESGYTTATERREQANWVVSNLKAEAIRLRAQVESTRAQLDHIIFEATHAAQG